jgi:hypothetical protein
MTDTLTTLPTIPMSQIGQMTANVTLINIVLFLLGTIGYFVLEYKLKRGEKDFSMGYWIRDNWYNVIFSACCITAYFIIQKNVEPITAFTLGLAPNLIADWAGKIVENMKGKV